MTPKQTSYTAARIAGASPSEAYRAAYSAENMSPKAISVEAAKLERHPSVSLAITQGNQKVVERLEKTAEDIARFHWSVIDDTSAALSDRLKASSLEMRRYQEYSDKREVSSDVRILGALASMTTEQLEALARGRGA